MPDEPPVTSADPAIAPTVNGMESGAGGLAGLSVGGGCAAKYAAARLEELVRGLAPARADDLLVGLDPSDDAAVYRLDDERALVFTVDFFPPLVDDPALFGRIAATNALNDVFAMGGRPLVALSVAAFPEELGTEVVAAVFAGAAERVRVAGAVLGTVHPDGVWVKSGARPGDAVFLTKPLGTGLVLAAKANLEQAARWMTTLNDRAADLLRPFSPNAVTDVTGFGLLGHARETAERSGVRIRLRAGDLPALEGALEAARAGVRTGGDPRNREFAAGHVTSDGVPEELLALAYDAQTAGGLLVTLPAEKAASLAAEFARAGLFLARIGAVEAGSGVVLEP